MAEFRRIKMSSFVILVLLFKAVTGQNALSLTVRAGDEVTLPCENQDKCNSTSWLVSRHARAPSRELVNLGKIAKMSEAKSDRLNITAKCSLVIKNVTVDDVGQYSCRQFDKSGQQQGPDSQVHLSVINMDEHKNNDEVILFCSVLTYEGCGHTVKWLYEGKNNNVEISQSSCSATVTFKPHLNQKSNYHQLLKCNVTDKKSGQMLLCDVGLQSSSEKTGSTLEERNKTSSEDETTTKQVWWQFIIVAVGLAALLIIAVAVIRWKKTKENKTQMDENVGLNLNPAVTGPDHDMADPEDGVSYASINYTKVTNSKARVCGKDGDEDDAVTYSTVKALSSSAGASADPSDLYATVNKPNKQDTKV